MRTTNNQKPATTPTISAHDKKIQKRVDKFMQSIDGLLNDERLKMYALIFLRENQYLHSKKIPQTEMLPIYTFSTLFYDSCKKSKVEANRIEFTNGVMDRLAQAGLGKDYGTYLSKIKKGSTIQI